MEQQESSTTGTYGGLLADDLGRSDERPPLVLLHGLTFDRQMWRPALSELEGIDPGRRALAVDLPGHGSSPDAASYSVDALVERIHEVIVEARLVDPVMIGHSGSCATAAIYAARYATRGVVLVEGTFRAGAFASMAQSLRPMLRGPGFLDTWARITANTFRLEEVDPEVRDHVLAMSRPRQEIVLGYWQDLFERTPQDLDSWIDSAVTAISASGVSLVSVVGQPSPEDVAWLQTRLPQAVTLVWPRSGHFPHLAHPRRFAELLAQTTTWVGGRATEVATA